MTKKDIALNHITKESSFCMFLHPQDIRRVDVYLSTLFLGYSRTYMQKLMEEEKVLVNRKPVDKNYRLKNKDLVEVIFTSEKMHLEAEDIPLHIVFENNDFLIINKEPGISMHPAAGKASDGGTIVNALLHHLGSMSVISGIERPGLIHRLDKDTSGLLVVAKNDRTMLQLQRMMNKRTIKKQYLALVIGTFAEKEWFIESFIGRDPNDRKKMTAIWPVNPKLAQTRFRVLGTMEGKYSLVEVDLLTGRTHQIRVHMTSIGHPIIGDQTYGNEKINREFQERFWLTRQWLHAWKLSFELFSKKYEFIGELKSDHELILSTELQNILKERKQESSK